MFLTILFSSLIISVTQAAVLDNLEDGDNGNWWGGYWYTYDDSPNNGNSIVNPLPDAKGGIGFIPSDVTDQPGNNYAARMWGQLGGGYQYAFVGMGTNLKQNGDLPAPADISAYTGVRMKVKGNGRTYQFKLQDPNAPSRNYKVYLYTFTAGPNWTTITINFNETDLAYGWGNYNNKTNPGAADWNDKPPLSQVLRACEAFQWQTVDQTAGTPVDLWVDDIELIGAGTTLPTKPTSQTTGLVDNFSDGNNQNELGGYWFTFNDSANGGNTQVDPPQGADFQPIQPGADGPTDYCAKFSWTIANPTYANPFAALGTNLTPSGPPEVADASNTQGIRITYKSNAHHILKVTINDPTISSDPNGVPYQVGLPPRDTWTTVTFGWDEFVIPAYFLQENGKADVDAMNNFKLSTRLTKFMQFQVQSAPVRYKNGGTGEFYLDNVMTIGGSIAGGAGGGGGGGGITYTLTVNVNPSGGGTVSISPNKVSYNPGETVTLTAVPNSGYTFTGWSGSVTGTQNPVTIVMDSNKTVTANFQQIQAGNYTLTVTVSPQGGGTVTVNPNKTSYSQGEQVTLTATAASGYTFVGWSGSITGTQNPVTITMDSNKTVTANFMLQGSSTQTFTLTILINPQGGGTVTKNPNKTSYNAGETVILTATAAAGYTFVGWSGDAVGTQNPTTIVMNSNKTVTANFQRSQTGGTTTTDKLILSDNPLKPGQTTVFRNLKSGETVKIYDLLGFEVNSLKESGGQAVWDGKDKNGNPLSSGVYIYKGDKSGTSGKIIILR